MKNLFQYFIMAGLFFGGPAQALDLNEFPNSRLKALTHQLDGELNALKKATDKLGNRKIEKQVEKMEDSSDDMIVSLSLHPIYGNLETGLPNGERSGEYIVGYQYLPLEYAENFEEVKRIASSLDGYMKSSRFSGIWGRIVSLIEEINREPSGDLDQTPSDKLFQLAKKLEDELDGLKEGTKDLNNRIEENVKEMEGDSDTFLDYVYPDLMMYIGIGGSDKSHFDYVVEKFKEIEKSEADLDSYMKESKFVENWNSIVSLIDDINPELVSIKSSQKKKSKKP